MVHPMNAICETGEFKLRSGRIVHLRAIEQWQVYEGLLEGLPTKEMNRRTIEGIIASYREKWHWSELYLVAPTEEAIEYAYGGKPYPFGTPAALPSIACAARFTSLQPARDTTKDYSALHVIWFQRAYAFPIDTQVHTHLCEIDWGRHAVDLEY